MALEVQEANLGAVNYHKVVLEDATPEDRDSITARRAGDETKSTKEAKPDSQRLRTSNLAKQNGVSKNTQHNVK